MSGGACKSKRVSFNPDIEANEKLIFSRRHSGSGLSSSSRHDHRRLIFGILSFGVSSSPAARRLLRRIGTTVGKTLRFVSFGRKNTNNNTLPSSSSSSSSRNVSSSSNYLMKSKSLNDTEARAEAIEDCIKFLNSCSSSSLSRSNSVSTCSS